ncbi:MAG: long-chain-fatty-acid--CoA ligase [Burkholderiaceae bacterium]|nr:long-chain-fatty-acid--CoA ligase [Burkholderiaceae bacterium]
MYLTQGLHRSIQQKPDAIATSYGDRKRTFRELGERVARLASGLQSLGMKTGDRVAMLALNSDRYLEYQMAVPWGGGVLNPCNIRWSAAEIIYSLDDSASTILIIDDAFKPMIERIRAESKTIVHYIYAGEGETPAGMYGYEELVARSYPIEDAVRRGDDLAGVFYTGGTTGFPKGVMLSHTNLCSSGLALLADGFGSASSVYLHAAPMFHLADFGIGVAYWLAGATHVIIPKFDPEAILVAIERDGVSETLLVPTMIQMFLDHPLMQKECNLGSMKTIFYGASPMPEALINRAAQVLPNVEFVQAYGMTELAPLATLNVSCRHPSEAFRRAKQRAAGRAGFCVEVRIVDEAGKEVPRGTVGEVVARGPNVMQGYWGKPDQTVAAIRDGWMHTGDGGYMDEDGYVFIVDRIKDMIISGGENIYSAEVESALSTHPAVAASAVIGVPDADWGERVHAVVVKKPGVTVADQELIKHCKQLIAGYKCPRSVEFRDTLPLSGAGKILKVELRKPYWEGQKRNVS